MASQMDMDLLTRATKVTPAPLLKFTRAKTKLSNTIYWVYTKCIMADLHVSITQAKSGLLSGDEMFHSLTIVILPASQLEGFN